MACPLLIYVVGDPSWCGGMVHAEGHRNRAVRAKDLRHPTSLPHSSRFRVQPQVSVSKNSACGALVGVLVNLQCDIVPVMSSQPCLSVCGVGATFLDLMGVLNCL